MLKVGRARQLHRLIGTRIFYGPFLTSPDLQSHPLAADDELATILEGIGEGFYAIDRDWRIRRFNSAAARHFGRTAQEVLGRTLWETFPGARETQLGQLFLETMASRHAVKSETSSVVVGGRWLAYRLFPLGDGMGVVFRDITDRKHAEEQRDLLVRELHHRVNNTLATVQAIASQTFGAADASARETFEGRLQTLSRAHAALTSESWDSVELRELIFTTLRPYDSGRFAVTGPTLRVQPKSAVALSMAIHELVTNAVKYGALSVDGGRVSIAWEVKDARFHLRWQESGGPPVSAPARAGFGSVMIERVLADQLRGGVTIGYDPTGVACEIDAPLEAVREADPA